MADMMKFADAKSLDAKAIEAKVQEMRKEIFMLNMEKTTSGLEKPHKLKVLKKNIARLMTAKGQLK
jgi:large subunit ribosomal protein L29